MKLNKLFFITVLASTMFISCNKDDDETSITPPRDRGEQAIEDDEALVSYLKTHFYNYEEFESPAADFDYTIRFDTIAGSNAEKISIFESDLLSTKTITRDEVDYNLYVLKVREGEGMQPKFADSTFVTYSGKLLTGTTFDNTLTPVWFDLTQLIDGFTQGIVEFKSASGYEVKEDNSVVFNNDYGIGSIFLPSGLGYFSSTQPLIPSYSPIIFNVNLFIANEADHDNDGIPSYMEDLNGDEIITNDDTDEDGAPNYADTDDDGDGTPTIEEITLNEDGSIIFTDKNSDGIPDYLDPETYF